MSSVVQSIYNELKNAGYVAKMPDKAGIINSPIEYM